MRSFGVSVLLVVLAACGDDGGEPGAERTLATCTTAIGTDVPEFYRRYFRCVTIATTANGVAIASEDLPPHRSNYYGSGHANYEAFDTSRGAEYHANPNTLRGQSLIVEVPAAPVPRGITITADLIDGVADTNADEYPLGTVGIALDSVALFTGTAAPGMAIADERFTFDSYEGHPQNTGVYHYHRPTPGPLEVLLDAGLTTTAEPGAASLEVYGVLCDGTVVLGCTELDGSAPSGLDAQGGHVGDLRAADATVFFTARYHTHVCADAARGHAYTPEIQFYADC